MKRILRNSFEHHIEVLFSKEGIVDDITSFVPGMGKLHFLQGSLLPFLFRAPTQNDGLKKFYFFAWKT